MMRSLQVVCLCLWGGLVSCKSNDPGLGFRSKQESRTPKETRALARQYSGRVEPGLLERASSSNTRIVVDIGDQRAYLLVDGEIAAESPVSTAKPGKHTPRGVFHVSERVPYGKISTIYRVEMPYWMRLDDTPFGLHAGHVPGYPASAGCIRLPRDMAQLFYDKTAHGTQVVVHGHWNG